MAVEYQPRIKDLPKGGRPRERLAHHGSGALSEAELLAITLRTGTPGENALNLATHLLVTFTGLGGLAKASIEEMAAVHGIGEAKATQIKAALELGKRLTLASPEERPQVKSPADVANLVLLEMGLLEQEEMRVLLLDTKSRVLAMRTVYVGNLNTSLVRVGELFRAAVLANCAAVVVVHNHPSGDPTPSPVMWPSPGNWSRPGNSWASRSWIT